MPGRDGTGPRGQGPLSGGRRGYCGGAFPTPDRGGGRGWRNQYYATGLTGWQRAMQTDAQAAVPIGDVSDPFAHVEEKLAEVIERLERIESAGQD